MKNYRSVTKTIKLGLAFGTSMFILGCAGVPPHEEITRSSYVIKEAEADGARQLAPLELRNASQSLERAQAAMSDKDYQKARDFAAQAELEGELAKAKTEAVKRQKSAEEIKEGNRILKEELKRYHPAY